MFRSCPWVFALCASLTLAAPAAAQETVIAGTVADETGGVLPGVTVTALHVDSGNTFLGVSDGTGGYRIGALRTGMYNVSAELTGFATQLQESVEMLVGQTVVIDFTMTISTLEETVTVTGAAPLVDVQQSSMGGNVDSRQLEALPVNGRSWMQLTTLAPGSRVNSAQTSDSPSGLWATDFQVNLDGQPVSQTFSLAQLGQPRFSRDAIAEFEVVSSRFDATQGRSTGIQVNAVTKSGTNMFAGSLAGYFRHDSMNAADFFADEVLPYSNQQISGTFGGPIVRDRLHFFGYYEHEREPRSYFFQSGIPEFDALGNGPDGTGLQYTPQSKLFGGRVDGQLSDSTRLMVRGNGWLQNQLRRPERELTNHPSTLTEQSYVSRQIYGTLTHATNRTVNELKVGLNHFHDDRANYWGLRAPEINLAGLVIGPSDVINGANQSQNAWSFRNDFTMFRGGHTLKIGGELMLPSYYVFSPTSRDGTLFADAGPIPANIAELFPSMDPSTWNLDGLPGSILRRWDQTSGRYDVHAVTCDDPRPDPGQLGPGQRLLADQAHRGLVDPGRLAGHPQPDAEPGPALGLRAGHHGQRHRPHLDSGPAVRERSDPHRRAAGTDHVPTPHRVRLLAQRQPDGRARRLRPLLFRHERRQRHPHGICPGLPDSRVELRRPGELRIRSVQLGRGRHTADVRRDSGRRPRRPVPS